LYPDGESITFATKSSATFTAIDALDAVLEVLEQEKVDTYLCTGDVLGYGVEPSSA
jgi:hypothetical protein